jgi:D-alanyl-D-alanine-carboxypeptidase/D-alanyl-D-alanine-endopeptidase
MHARLLIVAFNVVFATSISCAASPPVVDIDDMASAMGRDFVANPIHVGLSIGIIKDHEVRRFNFGSIDRNRPTPPDSSTIYELASLTKTYTGMLLAMAVNDGKIALDDDVRRYLPANCANLTFEGHPIRIVDLASHTAGLPKNLPSWVQGATPRQLLQLYGSSSRASFLQAVSKVQLKTRPGTVFEYSNAGAQLIGLVLERVYGSTFDELVQRMIATPHGMPDTGTAVASREHARYASRYDGNGQTMPELAFWRDLPAAGYLKSTINDQLRYLAWNLDETDPVVALAHRVSFRHTSERGDDIGLFWFVSSTSDGRRLIRHAGGSFGTTSFELLYPDAKIAVVLLANDADASTEKRLAEIADKLAKALADAPGRVAK